MTRKQIRIIRSSWKTAGEEPVVLGILFYDRLFSLSPGTRLIFRTPVSMQTKQLMQTVGTIINRLDTLGDSLYEITHIADGYALLGLKAMDYPALAEALLWALQKRLGAAWSREAERAWQSFYRELSYIIREVAVAA